MAADTAEISVAFRNECESMILQAIREAEKEILVAIYSFSYEKIADALIQKHRNGCRVMIKMDQGQAKKKWCRPAVRKLKEADVKLDLISMQKKNHMHNKFIIIDRKVVISGSYNFTYAATMENWENLIRVDDSITAEKFAEEWQKIKSEP